MVGGEAAQAAQGVLGAFRSGRMCEALAVVEEVFESEGWVGGGLLDGAEDLEADIHGEVASSLCLGDHLEGELFGGGGDECGAVEAEFRHELGNGLFA